jgi:hypothetical protein
MGNLTTLSAAQTTGWRQTHSSLRRVGGYHVTDFPFKFVLREIVAIMFKPKAAILASFILTQRNTDTSVTIVARLRAG